MYLVNLSSSSTTQIYSQAIQEFVQSVNCTKRVVREEQEQRQQQQDEDGNRPRRRKVTSAKEAVKFLLARKFDVSRAIILYEQHEEARIRDGLYDFDPRSEKLKRELETGKFTILVSLTRVRNVYSILMKRPRRTYATAGTRRIGGRNRSIHRQSPLPHNDRP